MENAYLLYNVDIQIFNNKGYILDMCLCVQIMANRAVTGMEQSESLPPPYELPPPYTPRPVTCTVNMHTTTSGGNVRHEMTPTCHFFMFLLGFSLGMVAMFILSFLNKH